DALQDVVRAVQHDVFALALRIVGHRDDAHDATQEVLIRVVTKLASFRGESRFRTWVYRVASNALLNFRVELKMREQTFAEAGDQLDAGYEYGESIAAPVAPDDPAHAALVTEVKLFCTQGMLMCLDRPQRLAYVLGEILELDSEDGAAILEITPEAFRKRLSRARSAMAAFLQSRCGVANPQCRCRCEKLVPAAVARGFIDARRPTYQTIPIHRADRLREDIEQLRSAAEVFRSLPVYASPSDFASAIRSWIEGESGRLDMH
ncbi:MAG TPA: RNA polymerase sigma factor, partial [Burkholderiales bacterium]|nr:RNA polymerase sigma factor [Burkholderiales bacterium]